MRGAVATARRKRPAGSEDDPENAFWMSGRGPVDPAGLERWTIPKILEARFRREPEAIVYRVWSGTQFADTIWRDLRRQVCAVAAGLRRRGIQRGDRIAILGRSSPFWIAVDTGILAAGGITVGLYPTGTAAEIAEQLNHVGARAVFVLDHAEPAGLIEAILDCRSVELVLCGQPDCLAHPRVAPVGDFLADGERQCASTPGLFAEMIAGGHVDDPMRLFFTSGSTGKQKAVLHTQRSLLLSADAAVIRHPALRLRPQRVLAFLPLSHISPVLNAFLIPFVTNTVAYFGREDTDLTELIARTRPTYLALMPRHYQKLAAQLAERSAAFSGMRRLLFHWAIQIGSSAIRRHWSGLHVPFRLRFGLWAARRMALRSLLATVGLDAVMRAQTTSAAMPREVAALWSAYGLDLREGYGSTEAPVIACQLDPFPEPGTVGRKMPRPWYELEFAEDGEILVRSATLFAGYWNDPDETQRAMADGWYRTGDIGELDERANLRLVGRKKDVIITAGGKSLNPHDIEASFRNSPYISEIVVVGEARKFLSALVELSEEAVASWLRQANGAEFFDYETMAASDRVRELIAGEIDKGNAKLSRVAQIKRFRILARPLDAGRGEISATRKARRRAILENFHALIDDIYGREEENIISAQVQRAKLG